MLQQTWDFDFPGSGSIQLNEGPSSARVVEWTDLSTKASVKPGTPIAFSKRLTLVRQVYFDIADVDFGDPIACWPNEELDVEPDPVDPDIEVDGPVEDQQAIRSFLFYLRQAIPTSGGRSVSPLALSGDTYFGHVFWDADAWVFPALMLLDPGRAKQISQYRLNTFRRAMMNFEAWLAAGRPVAGKRLGTVQSGRFLAGALFPWESSITGKETVPGESRYQHHVSLTIAFWLKQAAALGLVSDEDAYKVLHFVAGFVWQRIVKRPDGKYDWPATMSPDEFHTGDNDLYTNVLAQWVLNGGTFDKPDPAPGELVIPRDVKGLITYDGDAFRSYKQAAAVLTIFPLQFPEAEKEWQTMMDRFEGKVTKNGPAMSESVHATIWARHGASRTAYAEWHESWRPFTNHPLLLFSEKRAKPVTYFTTGAAGCLNTVLYGFVGIRIDEKEPKVAKWKIALGRGLWLSVNPNLPAAWKKVTLRHLNVRGKRFALEVTNDEVKATPKP